MLAEGVTDVVSSQAGGRQVAEPAAHVSHADAACPRGTMHSHGFRGVNVGVSRVGGGRRGGLSPVHGGPLRASLFAGRRPDAQEHHGHHEDHNHDLNNSQRASQAQHSRGQAS